ncbi:MAG TPA: ribbon-helix-helix protein, CopG family [Blastocatellia bacterium]|nr:ribbon-helix-helix protein, CopG family [Blastocatellia bacterium]
MKSISLKLSKALDAKLTSAAKQRRTTKTAILRAALDEYLARHAEPHPESVAALAKDLIGIASGGPPDLSYNKKHMEGFGRD